MKILSNKKYKELIEDREWALKNYARAERIIKEQQKNIDLLLFNNSELRDMKRQIEKKLKEKPKVNDDNTFTIEFETKYSEGQK